MTAAEATRAAFVARLISGALVAADDPALRVELGRDERFGHFILEVPPLARGHTRYRVTVEEEPT